MALTGKKKNKRNSREKSLWPRTPVFVHFNFVIHIMPGGGGYGQMLLLALLLLLVIAFIVWFFLVQRKRQHEMERQVKKDLRRLNDIVDQKTECSIDKFDKLSRVLNVESASIRALRIGKPKVIRTASSVTLNKKYSGYRIETPGVNTIPFHLPRASTVPFGQLFLIAVSKSAIGNTVNFILDSPSTDIFSGQSSGPTSVNPVYIIPQGSQPDQVVLYSDGVSTWYAIAHV